MMLRIAIVENREKACDQICRFTQQFAKDHNLQISTRTFSRADLFLAEFQPIYDIVFLGTEFSDMSGMDAARQLRKLDSHVVLVFVTRLAKYVIQGYEVDALDVLVEPLNYYAFSVKLERAIRRVQLRTESDITLQASDGVHRLKIRSIYYLETRDRMLYYHTADGTFSVRGSLKNAEEQLAPYSFAKCNQCYLVNLQYVTDVQDDVAVVAGTPLEISRRSRKSFWAAVVSYIGGV